MKTLKKIDPMSLATVGAILGAVWGLLVAIAAIFIGNTFTAMMGRLYTGYMEIMPAYGVAALVVLPIAYGLTGFIGGYIGALVYSWVAVKFGGVKVDLA